MTREQLENNLGKNVKVELFDGDFIQGHLHKTGEEDFKNDPNLFIPKNCYFLTDDNNTCVSCLFKVSHIKTFKLIGKINGCEYVDEHFTKEQLINNLYIEYCPCDFGFETEFSSDKTYCNEQYQGDCKKCWSGRVVSNKAQNTK